MSDTYSGEFYCVKCKEKRQAEGKVVETNGRRMAKAPARSAGRTSTASSVRPDQHVQAVVGPVEGRVTR